METTHRRRVGQVITAAITGSDRTVASLAKATNIPRLNMLLCLVGDRSFTTDELAAIAAELGMKPSDFMVAAEATVAA